MSSVDVSEETQCRPTVRASRRARRRQADSPFAKNAELGLVVREQFMTSARGGYMEARATKSGLTRGVQGRPRDGRCRRVVKGKREKEKEDEAHKARCRGLTLAPLPEAGLFRASAFRRVGSERPGSPIGRHRPPSALGERHRSYASKEDTCVPCANSFRSL